MPFHFSLDRRSFLAGSAAGFMTLSARGDEQGDKSVDEDLVFLLNDTHIGEKHPPDSPVPSHLKQVVAESFNSEKSRPQSSSTAILHSRMVSLMTTFTSRN